MKKKAELAVIVPTGTGTNSAEVNPEERETPPLREMIMSDFVNAMKEISASVSENAHAIAELRKWNELYGEGGSRKKATLTYYV